MGTTPDWPRPSLRYRRRRPRRLPPTQSCPHDKSNTKPHDNPAQICHTHLPSFHRPPYTNRCQPRISPHLSGAQTSFVKMSSILIANSRASRNASGSDGSYFPVSIAFTDWRDTSSRSASSACDHPRSARRYTQPVLHRYLRLRNGTLMPTKIQKNVNVHEGLRCRIWANGSQRPPGRRKHKHTTEAPQQNLHHQVPLKLIFVLDQILSNRDNEPENRDCRQNRETISSRPMRTKPIEAQRDTDVERDVGKCCGSNSRIKSSHCGIFWHAGHEQVPFVLGAVYSAGSGLAILYVIFATSAAKQNANSSMNGGACPCHPKMRRNPMNSIHREARPRAPPAGSA